MSSLFRPTSIVLSSPPRKEEFKRVLASGRNWLALSKAIHFTFEPLSLALYNQANELLAEILKEQEAGLKQQEQAKEVALAEAGYQEAKKRERFFALLARNPPKAMEFLSTLSSNLYTSYTEQSMKYDPDWVSEELLEEEREALKDELGDAYRANDFDEAMTQEWMLRSTDSMSKGLIDYAFPGLWEEVIAEEDDDAAAMAEEEEEKEAEAMEA